MAIFNNMSITNKGQVLYTKVQAGQELHFTKMMVGSGKLDTRNPAILTALIEPKFDVGIQEITPNTELKTATISGTINNGGVTEATYICEIGLFAQDPDEGEILYAYGTAGQYGDYYAPASMGPFSWNYQINAAIGNAANVTIELSNLTYDYGVFNTNTTFLRLAGGNQKEINKSIDTFIDNLYKLSAGTVYTVNASGTNDYTGIITGLTEYKEPLALAVKIPNDSTGACTININGLGAKAILKANGNAVTNLKENSIYTMRYNGTNFILQGEGGDGNARPEHLVEGATATVDSGQIVGTMKKRSDFYILDEFAPEDNMRNDNFNIRFSSLDNINCANINLSNLPTEYLNESAKIYVQNLVPPYVKSGVKIGGNRGFTGTFTDDATAQAGHILSGQSAYIKGSKVNGNMPNRGEAQNAGGFGEGSDYYSMNNIPYGYYPQSNNGWAPEIRISKDTVRNNLGITADKIVSGQSIAGVAGNAQQKQSASGVWQIRSLASGASVSFTLPFTPSLLCALDNYSPKTYWMYSTENTNVIFSGRYSSSYTSPNCEMTISGNTITFKNNLKVVYSADINYSIQA